jgi:hypothetical protein
MFGPNVEGQLVRSKLAAIFIAVLPFLAGAPSAAQPQSMPNKPDVGRVRIYVYRPFTLIGMANFDVSIIHLDGRRLTRIRIGGHLVMPVSAGVHTLTTTESLLGSDTGRIRGETKFSAPAGSTIYLRYTESFGSAVPILLPKGGFLESTGSFRFELVPESEARAELANTKPLELDK